MADLDYCFQNLPDFQQIQCSNWLRGGIDGAIIFETNASIADYTVLANWTALINAGTATKVLNIRGDFPDGSVVEGENPIGCGNDNVIDGVDYVLNIMDYNVTAANDANYAGINGGTYYIAFHLCNEDQLLIVELPVSVTALAANVPASNKEKQRYNTSYKWSADKDWYPIRITSPTGLF